MPRFQTASPVAFQTVTAPMAVIPSKKTRIARMKILTATEVSHGQPSRSG
jgi:hypothetical protein